MFAKIKNQVLISETDKLDMTSFYKRMAIFLFQFTVYLVFPILILGSYYYIRGGDVFYGVIEIVVGVFLIGLVYFKSINYKLKTSIILFVFYVIAYFVLLTAGKDGGGLSSLMVAITFLGLLHRKNSFNWTLLAINTIILSGLTVLLFGGYLDGVSFAEYKDTWLYLALLITLYSVGIIATISYYKDTILNQFHLSDTERVFLENLVDSVDNLIVTIDREHNITMTNQRFNDVFSKGSSLIGMKYETVIDEYINNQNFNNDTEHVVFDNKLSNGDFCLPSNNRNLYVLRKVHTLIQSDSDKKRIIVLTDITERKENEDKLEFLSFRDQLTGLYNRRFYEVELERLDSARSLPLSMIMIDVNGLKLVNDSFGHDYGDKILIATANVITSCCRDIDIISRIGGDEFTIILPNVSAQSARILANRIQSRAKDFNIEGIQLSFSLGIATKETKDQHIRELFKVMEDELYRNKLWESQSMRSKTIDLVLQTLYEKNNREMMHSKRVSTFSESLAKALDLSDVEVEEIKLAGLMHDIGKIGIDEAILNKPGKLDDEQWERMKQHSEIGYRILGSVGEFSKISQIVLHHHENFDGSGYPSGFTGNSILLGARIIRIADAYDAMTGERTYNVPLSKQKAISELVNNSESMFDKELVNIFINKVII